MGQTLGEGNLNRRFGRASLNYVFAIWGGTQCHSSKASRRLDPAHSGRVGLVAVGSIGPGHCVEEGSEQVILWSNPQFSKLLP